MGKSRRKENDVEQLVSRFEEALQQNEHPFMDVDSFLKIINFYSKNQRHQRALNVCLMADEQYPFSGMFKTKQAQLLLDLGRYEDALDMTEHAKLFDPNDIQIFLIQADIYVFLLDHDKAIEVLKYAISVADKEELENLYLELADVYEDKELYFEVIECMKEVLEIDPRNTEALNRIWFSMELTGQYDKSIEFHKKLIDKDPYNFLAWNNLAQAYAGLELTEHAIDAFEYVIAINENYSPAYVDISGQLMKDGKYQKAIDYLLESIELEKANREVYFKLGLAYEANKEYAKARHFYRKSTLKDKDYHEAHFRIGKNYVAQEQFKNAINAFNRALKIDPENIEYLGEKADAYFHLEWHEKAADLYLKILTKNEGEKQHWIDLASSYYACKRFKDALSTLDEAENRFGDEALINYIKSVYYFNIGNSNEALVNLEKGLLKNYDDHMLIFKLDSELAENPKVLDTIESYKQ